MIGALALIVIGPKDLPIAMRRLGQFIGKMRAMAAEFRASFDELARQSELDDLRKEVEALRISRETLTSAINPLTDTGLGAAVSEIKHHMEPLSLGPKMTAALSAAAETPALPPPVVEPTPTVEPTPVPVTRPKAARKSAAADTPRPKAGAKSPTIQDQPL